MTLTLDASCPITPLLPYLLHFNASAVEQSVETWAHAEADNYGSSLPVAVALVVASALLLFAGERLVKLALFLCGALVAFVVSLIIANGALSAASVSPTAGCVTLIAVPLLFGIAGGCLTLYMLTLAFALAGFAAGAAVGQFVYLLVLHNVSTGVTVLDHDLMFFLTVLALAIPGSILLSMYKEQLIIFATAALGAVGLVPGLALLVLSRFDDRFLWVTDPSDANEHRSSPFVYGQVLAALVYFAIGVSVQRHCREKKAVVSDAPQPYGLFQDSGTRTRGWNGSSNA